MGGFIFPNKKLGVIKSKKYVETTNYLETPTTWKPMVHNPFFWGLGLVSWSFKTTTYR